MTLADRLRQGALVDGSVAMDGGPVRMDLAEVKREVQDHLLDITGAQLFAGRMTPRELEQLVYDAIQVVLARDPRPLSGSDRARIVQEVIDEVLGNGPLEPLLRDDTITEVMVNRFDAIYVERDGQIHETDAAFDSEQHLRQVIDRIVSRVGRRVDKSSPMVDARLPDGSRVNAVLPPIAVDGANLTIRKFSADPFTSDDLVMLGTLTPQSVDLLRACVAGRLNVLVSGGTGSGKTTTLNVVSSFIPENERIITIEDAAELNLGQPHVVRMESRPENAEGKGLITTRDLVRNSLRMRPDRILVGEVRDAAALDMLQAMNTGHDGSLSTVHANSARDAFSRLETMVLLAGIDMPIRSIREQIARAIQLVVHQARLRDGSRHVTNISEVTGLDGDTILMQDLFAFEYEPNQKSPGRLQATGIQPTFVDRLAERSIMLPPGTCVRPR